MATVFHPGLPPSWTILDRRQTTNDSVAVLTRLSHGILILALLAATGGHWAILQTVAWTGMLANNLRSSTLCEAIEHTFDGKHPCCLCRHIAAGKKAEKKSEFSFQLKKFEYLADAWELILVAPTRFWRRGPRRNRRVAP